MTSLERKLGEDGAPASYGEHLDSGKLNRKNSATTPRRKGLRGWGGVQSGGGGGGGENPDLKSDKFQPGRVKNLTKPHLQ